MDQMNISITDELAGYVRKKVKTGRYNNASEVVREALRRMEDRRPKRLAARQTHRRTTFSLTLTEVQLEGIRRRVREGLEEHQSRQIHRIRRPRRIKEAG